jgi:phosphatidylglycerol:prolipoprotein diacylglycerol transferase
MPLSWQTLPLSFDPIAGYFGGVPVTWYAVMYILGAAFSALYFVFLGKRRGLLPDADISVEVILSVLWGVLIGARLGYVFFYGGSEFIAEPWRIISPYDFELDEWVGIRGMSFHGGLFGGALGLFMFTREGNRSFLRFSDLLVQTVPIAIFLGRLGNFLNHEILGRSTGTAWGMYFSGGGTALLHPVTLYEAAFEGAVLFIVMMVAARFIQTPGRLTALFLLLYAIIRYLAENYRAVPLPEDMVFGAWSIGQALSFVMVLLAVAVLLFPRKRVV